MVSTTPKWEEELDAGSSHSWIAWVTRLGDGCAALYLGTDWIRRSQERPADGDASGAE